MSAPSPWSSDRLTYALDVTQITLAVFDGMPTKQYSIRLKALDYLCPSCLLLHAYDDAYCQVIK